MRETTVASVMTRDVATASVDSTFRDLVEIMQGRRVSGLAVTDEGRLAGIVTEADLLRVETGPEPRHRTDMLGWLLHPSRPADIAAHGGDLRARDLMTRDVVTVTPATTVREAARTLLASDVRRMPVVDDQGRVVGIVSRHDLLRPFLRPDDQIRDEVLFDVVLGIMWIDPHQVTVEVHDGVVHLAGRVDIQSQSEILERFVRRVDGVVGVVNQIVYDRADRDVRPAPVARSS